MRAELELPRAMHAPRLAREAVSTWYAVSLEPDELRDAQLVASELATNALVHGVGRIRLLADLDQARVRIEVVDDGMGFAHTASREVPLQETRGRGLLIVDAVATRWGVFTGTTHVWAEIRREGPGASAQDQAAHLA